MRQEMCSGERRNSGSMDEQQIDLQMGARSKSKRWVSGRRARVLLCASGMCFMIRDGSSVFVSRVVADATSAARSKAWPRWIGHR
jgi:hypothetical protein